MRVFDETKTTELYVYDLEQGFLRNDKIITNHHPAVKEVRRKVEHIFPNGGKSLEWVVDVPAKDAWDEYEEIQVYVPYTAEQLKDIRIDQLQKRLSQLSEDFVQAWAGAYIFDLDERKKEFSELHNELRMLLGKTPRTYY